MNGWIDNASAARKNKGQGGILFKKAPHPKEENNWPFSLKSAFFKVEKCPFPQKSALLFEKKDFFRENCFVPVFAEKCPF